MADEDEIRELIGELGTDQYRTRAAQGDLVRIGKPAVIPLIQALKDEDWRVRDAALKTLGKIGKPAVPALVNALKDQRLRLIAIVTLGEIDDSSAVAPLVIAVKDNDPHVRSNALWALEAIRRRCTTIEFLEIYERELDGGLARLQKKYKDDDLIEVGFQMAKLKKRIAAKKNELASQRDLLLEDIPKPPPKKKGRMYQSMRRIRNG